MIELERPADLAQYVGKEIGVSDWFTVDQVFVLTGFAGLGVEDLFFNLGMDFQGEANLFR